MEERRLTIFGIPQTRKKMSGGRVMHSDYTCLSSGDVGGKHGVAFIIAPYDHDMTAKLSLIYFLLQIIAVSVMLKLYHQFH